MNTDELIERLAQTLEPVSRLRPPAARTALWLGLGIPYVALVVVVMSPRSDLFAKLSDPRYLIEQSAALATGITAGLAAFASIVPGFDRRILLLPLFPFSIWLGLDWWSRGTRLDSRNRADGLHRGVDEQRHGSFLPQPASAPNAPVATSLPGGSGIGRAVRAVRRVTCLTLCSIA